MQPGSTPRSRRIAVVTGGTGFIGWNLCERLLRDGWVVRAAVRPSSDNPLPAGVDRVAAELELEPMSAALEGAEVVFHLAGLTRAASYEAFARVNVEGARQVAQAAARCGTLLLLVSSIAAAGPGTAADPRREDDPPEPVSWYGRSKLAGERAVAQVGDLHAVTVRPPAVYGRHDTDFLTLFRLAALGWMPVLGSAGKGYTMIEVADAVDTLVTLAVAGLARRPGIIGEAFNIGHAEIVDTAALRRALSATFGRRVRRVFVPRPLLWTLSQLGEMAAAFGRPGLMNRSRYREITAPGFVCDTDKIARLAGWRASTDLCSGFARAATWYRQQGLLAGR